MTVYPHLLNMHMPIVQLCPQHDLRNTNPQCDQYVIWNNNEVWTTPTTLLSMPNLQLDMVWLYVEFVFGFGFEIEKHKHSFHTNFTLRVKRANN